jgi:hypothetical protein
MSSNLKKEFEDSLKAYSIYVEYWDSHAGDTNILFGHRHFLQQHLAELTDEQKAVLHEIDQRVLALTSVDYDNEAGDDDDVRTLGFVADIIKGIPIPPADVA